MTVAFPEEGGKDELAESGEFPLGAEGIPSTEAAEAIRAAAAEAEVAGGASDYTAEGDMSQAIANDVRKALRKNPAPKQDLFAGDSDPHLTDAARIAAEIGEMSVIGVVEGGSNDETARAEEPEQGPDTNRPIASVSLRSLAPMLSYGKEKTEEKK